MALTYPFNQEVLILLRSLGYKYLVVDHTKLTAYALRKPIDEDSLEILNWKQYDIDSIKAQDILNSGIKDLEVPENIR